MQWMKGDVDQYVGLVEMHRQEEVGASDSEIKKHKKDQEKAQKKFTHGAAAAQKQLDIGRAGIGIFHSNASVHRLDYAHTSTKHV